MLPVTIARHAEALKALVALNPAQTRGALRKASAGVLAAVRQCVRMAVRQHGLLTAAQINQLTPFKKKLVKIADGKTKSKDARRLIQSGGSFCSYLRAKNCHV